CQRQVPDVPGGRLLPGRPARRPSHPVNAGQTTLLNVNSAGPPIQSATPQPGLTPIELAHDLLSRIEVANSYARSRKQRFRATSAAVKVMSLVLGLAATIILGLQSLNVWTSIGFSLVAAVTVVNALEPFFAWRPLWVLMEETQHRFYRLRDDLTYYIAECQP